MIHAQMYHTKELPRDLCIHGDPYEHENVCDHLKEIGVLFYRDENHSFNALKTPKIEPNTPILYSQTIFNQNTWTIDKWNSKAMDKIDKTFQDSYVWLKLNSTKTILKMSKNEVVSVNRD